MTQFDQWYGRLISREASAVIFEALIKATDDEHAALRLLATADTRNEIDNFRGDDLTALVWRDGVDGYANRTAHAVRVHTAEEPGLYSANSLGAPAPKAERDAAQLDLPAALMAAPAAAFLNFDETYPEAYTLHGHLERQLAFSLKTFGPGLRTEGVLRHLELEIGEVRKAYAEGDLPAALGEAIDCAILSLDAALRIAHAIDEGLGISSKIWRAPAQVVRELVAKQLENERRSWPDWRDAPEDAPIEHVRPEPDRITDLENRLAALEGEKRDAAGR